MLQTTSSNNTSMQGKLLYPEVDWEVRSASESEKLWEVVLLRNAQSTTS
jgi:hypothetical protein